MLSTNFRYERLSEEEIRLWLTEREAGEDSD